MGYGGVGGTRLLAQRNPCPQVAIPRRIGGCAVCEPMERSGRTSEQKGLRSYPREFFSCLTELEFYFEGAGIRIPNGERETMTNQLQPGDNVVMTKQAQAMFSPPHTGIVTSIHRLNEGYCVVRRDGQKTPTRYASRFWQKVDEVKP